MGNWSFNYNGLGELLNQQDANNQTAEFTYDPLGRLIQKTTAGPTLDTIIDRWKYDDDEVPAGLPGQPGQAPAFNQFTGLLGSSSREVGGQLVYARVYAYESNKGYLPAGHHTHMQVAGSLPESYTLGIDNDPYFARPKAIIYPYTLPNGEPVFSSFIRYNKQGYITQEGGSKQYAAGGFYRQVESMNAYGSVTREQYGNGLYQDAVDYAATGQLAARHVTTSNGAARLDYNYSYDRWGNLSEQKTEGLARKESFSYDQLHRLTASGNLSGNLRTQT
ncbi:MAG: RHS repeat protein [Xanthomonadales bacterium]|nr:RHS repeat protein [Xanthomonadales bacterium]